MWSQKKKNERIKEGARRPAGGKVTDGAAARLREREKGEVRVCAEKVEWLKKNVKNIENGCRLTERKSSPLSRDKLDRAG